MKCFRQPDAESAAFEAARHIEKIARELLYKKPLVSIAFSGGTTPAAMFQHLSAMRLDWGRIHIFQVDERIAPPGDAARNSTEFQKLLLERVPLPVAQFHPMPVEAGDLQKAAMDYAAELRTIMGDPPQIDILHLGIGADGHTASLLVGDDVYQRKSDVIVSAELGGYRRMTLNFQVLNNAQHIVWLITGSSKRKMLKRMLEKDEDIPAGRVSQANAVVVADSAACPEKGGISSE